MTFQVVPLDHHKSLQIGDIGVEARLATALLRAFAALYLTGVASVAPCDDAGAVIGPHGPFVPNINYRSTLSRA